jgi:ketosteroid isomerase-like protein
LNNYITGLAALVLASAAAASTPAEVTAPIHQFVDGFNSGDTKSAFAAYEPGIISITDEFAPHRWVGRDAAHAWAAEYDKHAAATGVSEGIVKVGEATRSEIEGDLAYVIVPTVYTYKEHGKPIMEEGQMTYVLHKSAAGWKIRAWTWTGVVPHPAK